MSKPPDRPAHPLKDRGKSHGKPAVPKATSLTPAGTEHAVEPAKATTPQLAGDGRPYITLAQFLKKIQAAASGGEAKAMARSGIATVNGEAEARPGRKLFAGDRVVVAGVEHRVDLSAG